MERSRLRSNVNECLHTHGPAGHDVNELAASVVDAVTQNMESGIETGGKNPAAVTLRCLEGNRGGPDRAKSQTRQNEVILHVKQPQRARQRKKRGKKLQ